MPRVQRFSAWHSTAHFCPSVFRFYICVKPHTMHILDEFQGLLRLWLDFTRLFYLLHFYSFSISAIDSPVFAAIVSSAIPAFFKLCAISNTAFRSPLLNPDFSPSFTPAS